MIEQFSNMFLDPIKNYGPKIPEIIITLIIGVVLVKIASYFLVKALKLTRISAALVSILSSMIIVLFWVLFFSEIARQAGLSNLALTISGSVIVIGLALANGASSLTADIISGLFLAKDPDFEIGYLVKSGDIEGIIRKIDIRKIRIRDKSGKLHIIPNNVVDKSSWVVISREPENNEKNNTNNYKSKK